MRLLLSFLIVSGIVGLAVGCASSRRIGTDRVGVDGGGGADLGFGEGGPAPDSGGGDGASVDAHGGDGASADAGTIDAGHDASVVDAGHDGGATDAGHDAGAVDAGHDAGTIDAGPVTGGTVHFPSTGDTVHTMATNYWNLGDYVEGSRTTTLPSITHATLNVVVMPNTLTADTQDMKVVINGVMVGTFMIHMGDTVLTNAYTFPAITGPTYTLHFETTRTVMGGDGSAGFDMTTSTVTLAP